MEPHWAVIMISVLVNALSAFTVPLFSTFNFQAWQVFLQYSSTLWCFWVKDAILWWAQGAWETSLLKEIFIYIILMLLQVHEGIVFHIQNPNLMLKLLWRQSKNSNIITSNFSRGLWSTFVRSTYSAPNSSNVVLLTFLHVIQTRNFRVILKTSSFVSFAPR